MAITEILEKAEGGAFFAHAARAAGVSEAEARTSIGHMAPAIAQRLKDKAAADPEAFEQLLDLIEEGDASELDEAGALTDADAQQDGAAIIKDIYGSGAEANAALKGLAGSIDKAAASTLASISATAVLASLSATNASRLSSGAPEEASALASSGKQGFFAMIVAALMKGLLQGASRQLAPRRRRRRYSSYGYGRRPARRRRRSIGLDDVFREVLRRR